MASQAGPAYNAAVSHPRPGVPTAMTLLYTDPLFLQHDTGPQPYFILERTTVEQTQIFGPASLTR